MTSQVNVAGTVAEETPRLGRTRKYNTEEEKTEAQRHNALLHYHRKKALTNTIKELEQDNLLHDGDVITVHVSVRSRALGNHQEDIYYRVINKEEGIYQKITRDVAENNDV